VVSIEDAVPRLSTVDICDQDFEGVTPNCTTEIVGRRLVGSPRGKLSVGVAPTVDSVDCRLLDPEDSPGVCRTGWPKLDSVHRHTVRTAIIKALQFRP
jgi:hypothetical protein